MLDLVKLFTGGVNALFCLWLEHEPRSNAI